MIQAHDDTWQPGNHVATSSHKSHPQTTYSGTRPYIMGVRDRPRPTKMAVRVEEVALICFLSMQNYHKSGHLS